MRQIVEQRLAQLTEEMQGLVERVRANARRDLAEQLNMAVRRLRLAPDADELFATLVDAAASFAGGAAVFRIEGEVARGGPVRGVPEAAAEGFRGLEIPLASATALAEAAESCDPVATVTAPSEVSAELGVFAGHAEDARAFIYPLVVRGRTLALLYTWGTVEGSAIELLTQLAAAVWTIMPAPADLVSIAPSQAAAAPTAWEKLSAEEQQLHLRAQRFARVQVAEMRLFETDAVQSGRASRDLYAALRVRIDKARDSFRRSFFTPCPSMVDYLHLELVKTLAHDDPDALGTDYPGPMV